MDISIAVIIFLLFLFKPFTAMTILNETILEPKIF